MMKKNYCIFSAQFLPHMGGVENYTYHLAKELVKKGNEVTVVSSNVEHTQTFEHMEGIHVYRLPCWNLLNGRFPVLKMNSMFWKIHRIISRKNYDLVVINTRFYVHSLYGVFFAKKKREKMILVEHGTGHLTLHHPVLDFVVNIVEHTFTGIEKICCKDFYGVSEACIDWLQHFHIRGKGVLYNAVDLDAIEKELEKPARDFRKEYGLLEDDIVVSFTGRLLREKGILTLVQAMEHINATNQKVHLFIAGDGPEMETIQKSGSKRIHLLGRLSQQEVFALLKNTDIFCLPSDSEGMPTSVLEAVAAKNYVVTTARGGAKEIILNEQYGMVIQTNDLETVQTALEKAIGNAEQRESAVNLSYARLREKFTWEKVADELEKI